jgi:hypothetical protein
LSSKFGFLEQTNSSIAWKIEIHNSYSADLFTKKKANSEKLGLGIDNPCRIVFFFFEFADEQVLGEG